MRTDPHVRPRLNGAGTSRLLVTLQQPVFGPPNWRRPIGRFEWRLAGRSKLPAACRRDRIGTPLCLAACPVGLGVDLAADVAVPNVVTVLPASGLATDD